MINNLLKSCFTFIPNEWQNYDLQMRVAMINI